MNDDLSAAARRMGGAQRYPSPLRTQLMGFVSLYHPARLAIQMCAVQKWHTSLCRISLRRANCLAKINHAGWLGCVVGGFTHVPIIAHAGLCRAVFGGRRGQRPVIRLRGARRNLRAFRGRLCASGTDLSATALRGTRLRISAALLLRDAGPRIPRTGIGLWRVRTALRRAAGLCRPRARLSRALRSRASLRSRALLRAGIRLRSGICAETASARALPRASAGTMRRRLWRGGLLRLRHAEWVERPVRRSSESEGGGDTTRRSARCLLELFRD